jgi:hypothetical protein
MISVVYSLLTLAVVSDALSLRMSQGLNVDMRGKIVFIGGVADSTGYGWAIAKACAEAGAKILLGTWPPVMPIFQVLLLSSLIEL